MKRAIALAASVVLLTACRVDTTVDVAMNENGSGTVTVAVEADADVLTAAPGLLDDLRFDDLTEAGWAVDEPVTTDSGGATIALRHTFDTPEQATALIATLNGAEGPLRSVSFSRAATKHAVTFTLTGSGRADDLNAFTDPELLAAVGATPYLDDIAAAGSTVADAASVTLTAHLPGQVSDSTATPADDGSVSWTIRPDGVPSDLATTSSRSLERGNAWNWLAGGALVALVVWIVLVIAALVFVARARRRRTRRLRRL